MCSRNKYFYREKFLNFNLKNILIYLKFLFFCGFGMVFYL